LIKAVGIRFKKAGKIYYFDPGRLQISKNHHVIVETTRGLEIGMVVLIDKSIEAADVVLPLRKVIRVATDRDLEIAAENIELAKQAFVVFLDKIKKHELEMNLIDVEYAFDRSKLLFSFTADGRIDFRELVRDLANIFHTRIELRQIGVRDEAKVLGGIGSCGRVLCCSSFLGDFVPVSIKMAKDQSLSLNPTKISGICGRLMCCLKYENDDYEAIKDSLPDIGDVVVTLEGEGKVVGLNILEKVVQVYLFKDARVVQSPLEELVQVKSKEKSNLEQLMSDL